MRLLLLGGSGQLGQDLFALLRARHAVLAPSRRELDLSDFRSIGDYVSNARPNVIINAAAFTDVDRAEIQTDEAAAVNHLAVRELAKVSRKLDCPLIHFSTDYVFDGESDHPYDESMPPHPLGVYGKTKLEGELALQELCHAYLIFRTSWLYSVRGNNFFLKIIKSMRGSSIVRVANDQTGIPNWSQVIAKEVSVILESLGDANQIGPLSGVYHLSCSGFTTRYEWALEIVRLLQSRLGKAEFNLQPISSDEIPLPARRPRFSVLANGLYERTFARSLPDWKLAHRSFVEGIADLSVTAN